MSEPPQRPNRRGSTLLAGLLLCSKNRWEAARAATAAQDAALLPMSHPPGKPSDQRWGTRAFLSVATASTVIRLIASPAVTCEWDMALAISPPAYAHAKEVPLRG
jgi:hypothetical protein